MGFFSRRKNSGSPDRSPRTRGHCGCPEHIEDLLEKVVPYAPAEELDHLDDMTVGDLVECEALSVEVAGEVWADLPFHWSLWVGDEARSMYDDDAAVQLDEALLAQPGVDRVEWQDREIFHVSAPSLCADGILAATARALIDPRIKG